MANSSINTQIIMDSLRRIVQSIRRSSNQCQKFSELTGAQFFVLKNINGKKDLSINELAELTYTHQSTVSEIVTKLETMGLISRQKSLKDARRVELSLTDKGKAKLKSHLMTAQENIINSIHNLSKTEAATLARLLFKLTTGAGLSDKNPPLFLEDKNNK